MLRHTEERTPTTSKVNLGLYDHTQPIGRLSSTRAWYGLPGDLRYHPHFFLSTHLFLYRTNHTELCNDRNYWYAVETSSPRTPCMYRANLALPGVDTAHGQALPLNGVCKRALLQTGLSELSKTLVPNSTTLTHFATYVY